ncbi:uncharacterized protein LOC123502507 [Portunus trituberculatus]|uniref:uncharacterized protein LOC123502507 n=1 Tax=Portunus trituberculatus TaxID=210409 RepID=UPI001E1CE385|nr:uncharacterized protein LOC123502507 [Portunus trituberculatus]
MPLQKVPPKTPAKTNYKNPCHEASSKSKFSQKNAAKSSHHEDLQKCFFFFFFGGGRVDENEAQDGSESSSTSDTTPDTSFSPHATTDPSSLRSPVAVCVLALGVTCSNGKLDAQQSAAQHSTAQHSGEIGGELTIQRPDSTAVMSLVYLALSSLTTPTTNPSASATVSRSGKDSALHRAL